MNYIVTPEQVRQYLVLNEPGSTSRYSDGTLHSNIAAAQSYLENECHRFFYNHAGVTWATTTLLAAQVSIPGFRTFTSVTWGGVTLTVCIPGDGNTSCSAWGIWEQSPGLDTERLVVGLQFRPWRVDNERPWYMADRNWWDKALDSPFFPGNFGGGYAWTSMPNDLVIVGDGGYTPGSEPWALRQAVKELAAWFTMKPAGLFAQYAATPGGGSIPYQDFPPYVAEFIMDWKIGQQVASVG